MLPRLVLLSSGTIDDHLWCDTPRWTRYVLLAPASHAYEKLRRTEAILRSHSHCLSVIFIKLTGFRRDAARGHRLMLDEQETFISYLDLAACMIEAVVNEEGLYSERDVGVVNKTRGADAKFPHLVHFDGVGVSLPSVATPIPTIDWSCVSSIWISQYDYHVIR